MTLASGVTLARLFLLAPMLFLLLRGQRGPALGLLALILAGDLVDGALARLRREVTELGKFLDPAVDKLIFLGIFAALVWVRELPWLAFISFGILQLGIFIGALLWLKKREDAPSARPLGKLASFVLSLGLLGAFARLPYSPWVVYGGIALGYLAGVDYLCALIRAMKAEALPDKAEIPAGEGR